MQDLHPQNRCRRKASQNSKSQCEASLDQHGLPCSWSAAGCADQTCEQAEGPETCSSMSSLFCTWDLASGVCQSQEWLACNNTGGNNSASCEAASDLLIPGLGWQPYGKSTCQWESTYDGWTFCHKMDACRDYRTKDACSADPLKWGACHWNDRVAGRDPDGSCQDMSECGDYRSKDACAQDAFNVAAKVGHGYAEAKCWWHTADLLVGPSLKSSWGEPVATSGNLEIVDSSDDRSWLQFMDSSSGIGHILGDTSMNSMLVGSVLDKASKAVAWSDLPKPLPDGYTVRFTTCRDNLPSIDSGKATGFCTASSSEAECQAAELVCPSFCGWASCWLSACKKNCKTCA